MTALSLPLIVAPDKSDTVTITCPQCKKSKQVDLATFIESHVESRKALKTQCACGNVFHVRVNTRKHPRKKTTPTGAYIKFQSLKSKERGFFIIEDISLGGLRFRTRAPHQIQVGEVLKINFILNDDEGLEIWASLMVKHVHDFTVGGEFCDLKDVDGRIARYLASI